MNKTILLIVLILFSSDSFSQVDTDKVGKINSILCNCLQSNKQKNDNIRLEECTSVLYDGLSVIEDEDLRELYAQKSDTYLQRKCLEYVKIIYSNVPNSDVELVNKSTYIDLERKSLSEIKGKYYYKDYLGEIFNIKISESSWSEEISSNNGRINFKFSEDNQSLIFEESNDMFFNDFYGIDRAIDVKYNIDKDGILKVIFDLGNDIYLKKVLRKK